MKSGGAGFGIQMSDEDTAEERRYNEQVIGLLETRMIACGHVKPEMLPKLMDVLRSGNVPFGRVNSRIAFGGEPYLTLEEKRSLGLNTRRKYSREYIANFHQASLRKIDPHNLLVNSHLAAFHEVSRYRDLDKFRRMGFVENVRLRPDHECGQANTLRKIYLLGSDLLVDFRSS